MRELPILFTGPMVRAILDGSKTQTRRVIRPQPIQYDTDVKWGWSWNWREEPMRGFRGVTEDQIRNPRYGLKTRSPYGQPGDLLYVREEWRVTKSYDSLSPKETVLFVGEDCEGFVQYRADGEKPDLMGHWGRWRRSIHMPKAFSRTKLRVTDVTVERVQDITEDDAIAEGCDVVPHEDGYSWTPARTVFQDLWDSINSKRSPWSRNDWVWCVSFERIQS